MVRNFIIMMRMIAFAKDIARREGITEAEGMAEFAKLMSYFEEK